MTPAGTALASVGSSLVAIYVAPSLEARANRDQLERLLAEILACDRSTQRKSRLW